MRKPYANLNNPTSQAEDASKVGHWSTGNIQVFVRRTEDIEPVLALVERAYRLTV